MLYSGFVTYHMHSMHLQRHTHDSHHGADSTDHMHTVSESDRTSATGTRFMALRHAPCIGTPQTSGATCNISTGICQLNLWLSYICHTSDTQNMLLVAPSHMYRTTYASHNITTALCSCSNTHQRTAHRQMCQKSVAPNLCLTSCCSTQQQSMDSMSTSTLDRIHTMQALLRTWLLIHAV
jgi:hypothetical protein